MQNINSISELKTSIQLLEEEQAEKLLLLKEQFYLTYEGLKPVNLLKNTVNDIVSSPLLVDNIISTATGLVTGYISKKVFVGASGGVIRKLLGSALQYGVTNIIAKHPETVKSAGKFILNILFRKKENQETNSDK
jgi:hypothetical protein